MPPAAKEEVLGAVMAAKRYTLIESGVTHPNFHELFGMVTTPAQQEKVGKALSTVLAPRRRSVALEPVVTTRTRRNFPGGRGV